MPSHLSDIAFSLNDVIGGQPLTPENVDLPTLRGFLDEVEKLLKGNETGASLTDSRVYIKEGSLRIVTFVAVTLAASAREDLGRLEQTGDLDALQPKRAEVIEQWMARARRSPTRTYELCPRSGAPPIKITNRTQFQHRSENAWVNVEKYITGRVVDLGGKQNPNVHVVLSGNGESIQVNATEEQLAAEKENQLYKDVVLRVEAQQHLRTKALRKLRLIEFLPHSVQSDDDGLAKLWDKGREAWRDVPSASEWVESLRGNK
jgi:hypothetical protein